MNPSMQVSGSHVDGSTAQNLQEQEDQISNGSTTSLESNILLLFPGSFDSIGNILNRDFGLYKLEDEHVIAFSNNLLDFYWMLDILNLVVAGLFQIFSFSTSVASNLKILFLFCAHFLVSVLFPSFNLDRFTSHSDLLNQQDQYQQQNDKEQNEFNTGGNNINYYIDSKHRNDNSSIVDSILANFNNNQTGNTKLWNMRAKSATTVQKESNINDQTKAYQTGNENKGKESYMIKKHMFKYKKLILFEENDDFKQEVGSLKQMIQSTLKLEPSFEGKYTPLYEKIVLKDSELLKEMRAKMEEEELEKKKGARRIEVPENVDSIILQWMRQGTPAKLNNVIVENRDLETVLGTNWLNDEVINYYMELIMAKYNNQRNNSSSNSFGNPLVYGSDFYPGKKNRIL
ncbi:hypothetical protein BB560_004223 [Smittium megazygosporum]|uniref:Ubiquitin-like protease family profile domain-containing protein n=1 Tax=Smittium megazygosporum TaxID=133381 RepID=A0A2T9Z9T9_9FUNG|nr:hypothetical protein BB560_004223 [Smittium megazygosporum]